MHTRKNVQIKLKTNINTYAKKKKQAKQMAEQQRQKKIMRHEEILQKRSITKGNKLVTQN